MHCVYLLQSKFNNQIYVGSTNDLKRRMKAHNEGKEISTRRYMPWTLIYYESYMTEKLARIREKRLKHNGNALRELKKRVDLLNQTSVLNKPSKKLKSGAGFTLVELLVVIGIIAVLALIVFSSAVLTGKKGRDAKRKADVSQIGRFISLGCYQPDGGVTSIDLIDLAAELVAKNPQYQKYFPTVPKDPKSGSDTASNYFYIVDDTRCATYANLESEGEKITLPNLTDPTPGGGQGVLEGTSVGSNNTNIFFQFSN